MVRKALATAIAAAAQEAGGAQAQAPAPPPDKFACTFDHLGEVVVKFTGALGLKRYGPHIQDYGGPIGFRLADAH